MKLNFLKDKILRDHPKIWYSTRTHNLEVDKLELVIESNPTETIRKIPPGLTSSNQLKDPMMEIIHIHHTNQIQLSNNYLGIIRQENVNQGLLFFSSQIKVLMMEITHNHLTNQIQLSNNYLKFICQITFKLCVIDKSKICKQTLKLNLKEEHKFRIPTS